MLWNVYKLFECKEFLRCRLGENFVGIRKRWVNTYIKLTENHPTINAFQNLGTQRIPNELINGELSAGINAFEEFVCHMYSASSPTTLPQLRWKLFKSKNREGEILPPTKAALLRDILQVNFICM